MASGIAATIAFSDIAPLLSARVRKDKEKVVRALQLATKTWGLRVVQEVIHTTKPQRYSTGRSLGIPVDTGAFKGSWHATDLPDGALIYSSSPYASIIEHGRRPGPVSVWKIYPWVMRKVLTFKAGSRANRHDQAVGIAFAIAKTLSKRRILGRYILRRTADDLFRQRRQLFLKEIRSYLK